MNPDILDSDGNTVLHIACQLDKPNLVSFLLNEAQCNASITNRKTNLPLDMTANPEVINCFCQHDQIAVCSETVARWMNNKSIDDTIMMDILKVLVDNHINRISDGSTLLHIICNDTNGMFHDRKRLGHYLLTEGHSDPNCLDRDKRIPLQLTSDLRIMEMLVENGTKMTKDNYTVVSRKRAHYGLSAHPPVFPQFPAEV